MLFNPATLNPIIFSGNFFQEDIPNTPYSVQAMRSNNGWEAWVLAVALDGSTSIAIEVGVEPDVDSALLSLDYQLDSYAPSLIDWRSPKSVD